MSDRQRTLEVVRSGSGRLGRLAELTAVWAIGVQTVLSVFAASPETFVSIGAGPLDVLAFAVVVVLAPPVLAWGVEELVGLVSPTGRGILHVLLLGTGVATIVWELLARATDAGTGLVLGSAALAALGFVALYLRFTGIRQWTAFAAVVAPALLVWFLLLSPASQLLTTGQPAAAGGAASSDTSVVLVVLDELPTVSLLGDDGTIDADRFPNLAELAGQSTWYRNATTVTDRTVNSTPALLTGRLPTDPETAPVPGEHPRSLFTLLAASHDLHADEVIGICPTDLCESQSAHGSPLPELLGSAVDVWTERRAPVDHPRKGAIAGHDDAAHQLDRLRAFTERITAEPSPRLDYLHLMLPHSPWQLLADQQQYRDPEPTFGLALDPFGVWADDRAAAWARERHLLQLTALDAELGRLFGHLHDIGTWDETLLVVTADHGISFDAGASPRTWDEENADELLWVPMLVKEPGQSEGRIDDRPVRTIDLFPTIAGILGLDVPWSLDGRPFGDVASDDPRIALWPGGDWDDTDHPVDPDDFGRVLEGGPDRDVRLTATADEHEELVGVDLAELDIEERPAGEVELVAPDAAFPGPEEAARLPIVVMGRLDDGIGSGTPLVVAVNGRVAAVTPSFELEDGLWFATLTAPELHHPGENDVSILALEDGDVLRPLTAG